MKPHPRIRKTIKWGGAAVTLLLVVVWIASARYYLLFHSRIGVSCGFQAGGFIASAENRVPGVSAGWFREGRAYFFWSPLCDLSRKSVFQGGCSPRRCLR
jgi:hypothetical protein